MICVSIAEPTVDKCIMALAGLEMAEIRLDKLAMAERDKANRIFAQPLKLIATCRPEAGDEKIRKKMLLDAIEAGASFVDIEVETSDEYKREILVKAKTKNCRIIVSFHDHKKPQQKQNLTR